MRLIPYKNFYKLSPAIQGKAAVILVNGIFSQNDQWQPAACKWGDANTNLSWSFYNYSADALLTGFFMAQHADGLYAAYLAAKAAGATVIHIVSHSLGAVVTALAMQRHPDMAISVWVGLASADYDSFDKNGYNALTAAKQIGNIVLGTSTNDGVLGTWLQWFTPFFWGRTLGRDGPQNVNFVTTDFSKLPTQPFGMVAVGWDNTQTHTSWVDTQFVFQIIANILTRVVTP